MAHDLYIRKDGTASMISGKGITPWHRLGKVVEGAVTALQALVDGGLDFVVEKMPVFARVGEQMVRVPDAYSTIRTDTGEPLGIVGERYSILQNRHALDFFDKLVEEGEATYETAGVLGRGERVWLLARLDELGYTIGQGDKIETYLGLFNSHNGKSHLQVKSINTRVVCANTWAAAMGETGKRDHKIRHSGNVEGKLDAVAEVISEARLNQQVLKRIFDRMLVTKMSEKDSVGYFERVLNIHEISKDDRSTRSINELDALRGLALHGRGVDSNIRGTLWANYNAVTEYTTHHRTIKGEKDDPTLRLTSILEGRDAELNRRAMEFGEMLLN